MKFSFITASVLSSMASVYSQEQCFTPQADSIGYTSGRVDKEKGQAGDNPFKTFTREGTEGDPGCGCSYVSQILYIRYWIRFAKPNPQSLYHLRIIIISGPDKVRNPG